VRGVGRKRLGYIELNRKFQHIGECPHCGGVAFFFEVEQLDLYTCVSGSLIRKIRRMVSEGAQLERLLEEFPEEIIIEEWEVSICEKCGHQVSSPKHHVGA